MNPIVYVNSDIRNAYEQYSLWRRIKNKFEIQLQESVHLNELKLSITSMKFPPNFHVLAYNDNMKIVQKKGNGKAVLAPKTYRRLDYSLLNDFQKDLMGFSVIKSIQLILRLRKKSIKNSCIVIYDANDNINSNIIFQLAKEAKYIIFLSNDLRKSNVLREYVIANYGVSPIVTNDSYYALKGADFIVSSKSIEEQYGKPIWYIDNLCYSNDNDLIINDVEYVVPWVEWEKNMPIELLGAILSQMEEKDIEKSLKYNGIFLEQIKYNDFVIEI